METIPKDAEKSKARLEWVRTLARSLQLELLAVLYELRAMRERRGKR